jgi:phage terminase large subunit GpA-like protein
MREGAYGSAGEIAHGALDLLLPPPRQTVSEYALANRFLSNQGGGYVGRWTDDMAPYLVGPMDALNLLDYATVAVVGPGQSGKTEVAQNWLLKSVATDPGDMLWYMQTDPGLEAFVKGRINPMIDAHEPMSTRLGGRPVDDSLHFKQFQGMKVEFLSAAPNNLINKSAPRIVADEVDAYPTSLGDVKALLDVRRQTFGRQSTLLAMSHPDLARGIIPERDWTAGIMSIYGDSDRRAWYWPCPHCGCWSSPVPIASRFMPLVYPEDGSLDEIETKARLVCPVNGCLIEDHHRHAMNRAAFNSPFGGWLGEGQEIAQDGSVTGELVRRKAAGFWIVGAMSPFIMGGIGGLARARVKAQRELEVSGEDETLRQVMVKQWGFPYTPPRSIGSIDANDLADRAEHDLPLQVVPEGVRFMTATVDCQLAHFEWLVRGWGVKGESWIIDGGRIPGDPATSPEDWDTMRRQVMDRTYPLADGSGRHMSIKASGYDSGGAPGVTQQAYAAWSRWRRDKSVRLFGKIAGRDAWSIIPMKGANTLNAPRLSVVYPDTSRAANVKAGGGTVPQAQFNPNLFKDDLAGQLQRGEAGDWYVHFPWALRAKEAPHPWFEQVVAERRLPNGRWEKSISSARNEKLDLMVMAHAIAHLHGLSRINWDRPPSWAAEWDKNSLVIEASPEALEDIVPVTGSIVPTPSPAQRIEKKSLVSKLA